MKGVPHKRIKKTEKIKSVRLQGVKKREREMFSTELYRQR